MRSPFQTPFKMRTAVVGFAALSMLATGCAGGTADSGAPASEEQVTELTVGSAPSMSGVGLHAGIAEGEFADRGLEVTAVPNKSANEALPQLLNGSTQVTMVDVLTMMQARNQGLPVKIIAPAGVQSTNGGKEMSAASVVVEADSAIDGATDLNGKRVGVPALKTQTWMNIRAALDEAGVDSTKVEFVEAPPAQSVDLVIQGELDASTPNEPLASTAIADGKVKQVMNTDAPGNEGVPTSVFVATEEFIAENPDTVKAFAEGVQSAAKAVNEDRDLAVRIGEENLNFTPEQMENVFVQTQGDDPITPEELKKVADLALRYEVLTEVSTLDDLLADLG